MIDNKNLILAIVLSVVILFGFDLYFAAMRPPPPPPAEQPATTAEQAPGQASPTAPGSPTATGGATRGPTIPGAAPTVDAGLSREALLKSGPRVSIQSKRLHGSMALRGGVFDDITMPDYRETLSPDSDEIVLMRPRGAEDAYFAVFGWSGGDLPLPGTETPWQADGKTLSPDTPVTLTWNNGQGLKFTRTVAMDENYLFTVTQRVQNTTDKAVALYPYGYVKRRSTPEVTGFYILHEGLLGVFDDQLQEVDYEDIQEQKAVDYTSTGGWMGITDKYWLAALVPDQKQQTKSRFVHGLDGKANVYQVDFLGAEHVVPAGGQTEVTNRLFIGAKEVQLLDRYEEELEIARFDLAIDFGWFYFLTKPIFLGLIWINNYVANLGVSILILTVLIKLCFFPLANKSYVAMSKMKKLQPEITKLRERYGEDKVKLNQEMMALYKKEKANPAAGCLPILVQIPVFFALYKVLFVTIEMRHAPFFGWIQDLSAPDPTTLFNLFGLIPYTPPDFLMIGVWPIIMGISMFLQQKLNPQPPDPIQAKIFLFMPLFFTFLLARFPAGLVVYWAWNNVLSMAQQWLIMRRMGITGKQALS